MGISTNFYTIYGVKVPWDDDFNLAYDEAYDDPDTPWVLLDGMGGKYMILGEMLFDSGDARYGFEDGSGFTAIDISLLGELETKYKQQFITKFPQFKDYMDAQFKLLMLGHYS